MAKEIKEDEVKEVELTDDERMRITEPREVYATGFRNLDTMLGFRVYDLDGTVRQLNRGILSGSWIILTGAPHTGKSTLGLQFIGNMMKKFVNNKIDDHRVKLYMMDVEAGVTNERIKLLTGLSDRQILNHVVHVEEKTLENMEKLYTDIIKEKQDKTYIPEKRIGSQGYLVDVYPPTFVFIDSISELISENAADLDEDPEKARKMVHMKQGMMLDVFFKRFRHLFSKYNINTISITHFANKIDMNAMPGARPTRDYKGLSSDKKINGGKAHEFAADISINIEKIVARDEKTVETKGGKNVNATSISQARIFKNRQGIDGKTFFLVYDKKGKFDPLGGFLYECQQNKVITSAGAIKKVDGTDLSCRSGDLVNKFMTDEQFRLAVFNRFDQEYNDQLDSVKNTEEERQRTNDILDLLID